MKKRHLFLFLILTMLLIPSVKAGYNGASSNSGIAPGTGDCNPTWNNYCLWNTTNTRGLQITLYYYDNGSRRQLGRQIHVVANKQKFRNAGFTEAWLSGLIEDPNLELFDSRKLENYFLSDEVYKTYIENEDYIGVSMDELSLHSDAAPSPRGKGYRLVIEPMVSTMKKGTVYLKTVKEIAEVGITRTGQSGKQALKDLSKLLYLEHADVGVSAGNSSGTSDLNKMKSELNGWGYNIIDITSKIPPTEETIPECKWTTPTNCCHLKNDLTGTELANFLRDHPDCDDGGGRQPTCTSATPTTCNFNLNTSISNACTATSSGGYVKDMDNWGCIYESSAANNTSVKDYFLKHGTTTSACAVYCRDELQYEYPKKGMVALIGNRFSIGSNLNSWSYEVVGGQKKVIPATLGPVKVTIKRECSITGTPDAGCNNALQNQLNSIKNSAPTITFTYDSKKYGEVTETLTASTPTSEVDETIAATGSTREIKRKTVTFEYKLPSNTYRYVSKNIGVSYKNASEAGSYPVIDVGPHLPIHFSQDDSTIDFELNISRFNLTNFDNLVINGNRMPEQYKVSIESYIKTLIDSSRATPTKIGNVYYLNNDFVNLLTAKGYSADNFLCMDCADTRDYTCSKDNNGIVCYDEGTTSNSASTYAKFNACIGNLIQSGTKSYKKDLKYTCSFDVEAIPTPPPPGGECEWTTPDECCYLMYDLTGTELANFLREHPVCDREIVEFPDVIFRTISLTNPFPSIDGNGRNTGSNWCYDTDCSNTNSIVQNVILNNRDVSSDEVYKDRDPLYKIVLNPAVIKEIRRYNDTTKYDDFNLECNSEGNNCRSKFLRETIGHGYNFSTHFSGCGIVGKNRGLNCDNNEAW